MRIGYVLDLFPSVYQTYVLDEILQLEAQGVDVEVFSLQTPSAAHPQHGRLRHLRATVHYLPSPTDDPWSHIGANSALLLRSPLRYAQALASVLRNPGRIALLSFLRGICLGRLLAAHRVEHLHAHFALGANVVAMFAARFCDVTFSFTTHAVDLFVRPVWLCESLQAAQFAVTISGYNRDFIAQTCGDDLAQKVHVIHAGIDPGAFVMKHQPIDRRPRILSVGRLVEKKGHRHLIKALAQLQQKGYAFEAVIAGEGPERPALTRLITEHDLTEQIRLIGAVSQDTVHQLFTNSDIFVLPCIAGRDGDRDGIPVSLMEAMASGLPVICTSVSGIPELITHKREGLLAQPGDVTGLSEAMAGLLDNAAARETLARAAREKILREFDVRRNATELTALFAQMAERFSPQ